MQAGVLGSPLLGEEWPLVAIFFRDGLGEVNGHSACDSLLESC